MCILRILVKNLLNLIYFLKFLPILREIKILGLKE